MMGICAIFRNEAPYLREWIEFHRLVGFERFHLYQNRSDDEWEVALAPYKCVEVTDWPKDPPCQMEAYQDFINKHRGEKRWVAFLDCDEFLFAPFHRTVGEALAEVVREHWGAVAVNWMCFGAGRQESRAEGLVTERFTLRPRNDFDTNHHFKSIVRMDRVLGAGPNPHYFETWGGTFDETGLPVESPEGSPHIIHSTLRINHYVTKSRQEFLARIARGRCDLPLRRDAAEFDMYQSDEVEDTVIRGFLPALKECLHAHQD